MDIREVTYTDDNGEEHSCWDYLLKDGNLGVPGGRYGSWTDDCAYIAILLFVIQVDGGCEDSVDGLDGCMSLVVNSHDEVCWSILDNRHALEGLTEGADKIKLDPYAYFDAEEIEYARELYTIAYCGEPATF